MPDIKRSLTWGNGAGWINQTSGVYMIRKRVGGKLFEVSTRATSERAANKQLERFESDPANYSPLSHTADKVTLSSALVNEFLAWSAEEKKNTPDWVRKQKKALVWWGRKLGAVDLARVETRTLVDHLDKLTAGRKVRIAVIKAFYGWLIKRKHRIDAKHDPTGGITVPQSRPEQWVTPKVIPRKAHQQVRENLAPKYRDAVDILAGTGWHVSELCRFASGGSVEKHPRTGGAVLVCPRTKGGEQLRTEVSKKTADAGKRLLGVGGLKYKSLLDALRRAAGVNPKEKVAGREYIHPGSFRHTVATWAINAGEDPAKVSAFLGHKSPETTRRFYATHAVPLKVQTPD